MISFEVIWDCFRINCTIRWAHWLNLTTAVADKQREIQHTHLMHAKWTPLMKWKIQQNCRSCVSVHFRCFVLVYYFQFFILRNDDPNRWPSTWNYLHSLLEFDYVSLLYYGWLYQTHAIHMMMRKLILESIILHGDCTHWQRDRISRIMFYQWRNGYIQRELRKKNCFHFYNQHGDNNRFQFCYLLYSG